MRNSLVLFRNDIFLWLKSIEPPKHIIINNSTLAEFALSYYEHALIDNEETGEDYALDAYDIFTYLHLNANGATPISQSIRKRLMKKLQKGMDASEIRTEYALAHISEVLSQNE